MPRSPFRIFLEAVGVALVATGCGGTGSVAPTRSPATGGSSASSVAVVGDSISAGYDDASAAYVLDASHAWPALLGAPYDVTDFAELGAETADAVNPTNAAQPMLQAQVTLVDPASAFVVIECGQNDLAFSDPSAISQVLDRVDRIVAAVRSRAPASRIVLIGVRYNAKVSAPLVDMWDAREIVVAHADGARFVDLRVFAADDAADFPDGVHPGSGGAAKIAELVISQLH